MKFFTLLVAMLVFAVMVAEVKAQEDTAILANIDYSLSKEEFDRLAVSAMEGTPADAQRIVEFFVFSKRDAKKAEHWARIGAENGSAESQFQMFQILSVSRKVDDHRRALFWLKKSAESGHEHAKLMYESCNSIDARHDNPVHSPCFGPDSDG